jgi:hypothetical protein
MITNQRDRFFVSNLQIEDAKKWSLVNSSSENAIRRNAVREMMPQDDGWEGRCIRLQANTHPDADYLPLLMGSINPLCWSLA